MAGDFRLLNIFQIGDVRLHLHVDRWHGESLSAQGKSRNIQDSYRVLMPATPYQYAVTKLKISALLYNDGFYEESQFAQKIKSLVGLETDIIAYRQLGGSADVDLCCQCFCCDCNLMWMHTLGRITNIKIEAAEFHTYTLKLDLELQPTWTPLNRALFRWEHLGTSRTHTEALVEPYLDEITSYPDCEGLFDGAGCFYWRRRSILSFGTLYDPALFTNLHIATDPPTGYATDWNTLKDHAYVSCRPEYFGMAPLSVYAFDNLATASGTATISVRHPINIVNEITHRTQIDVQSVKDMALLKGIALVDTDILVVGDVKNGGFVVRNDQIVANVAPAISRNGGQWPGMLTPGRNLVEVKPPTGGRWAMNHTFRSL